MNAVTPRKDERGGSSGPSSDRKNRRNVSNEEGWSTATSSRSRGGPTFVVQSDKLKNKMVSFYFLLSNHSPAPHNRLKLLWRFQL